MINRYRHPFGFYFFSTAIPWLLWLTAAYLSWHNDADSYGSYISALGLAGLCGPLIVAAIYVRKDNLLVTDVLGRLFNFRSIRPVYLVLSLFLMPTSIILAMAISLLFGYETEQFMVSGNPTFTSWVLPVWFILLAAPILEELAWHSYGTDCLRQRYSLFTSSIIFAIIWAIWHLPLGLIQGYYHSNLALEGAIYGINFLVSLFPFVLIMNWLYYKTNRNIFVTVALHLGANVFNEIFATHPDSKVIQTIILCILMAYLLIKERDFFFKFNNNTPIQQPNQECALPVHG